VCPGFLLPHFYNDLIQLRVGPTGGLLNIHEESDCLLILSLYNLIICSVAAVLYVVVNEFEPNRRLASALKLVIVAVAVAAILGHLRR
jgi:hypothetical protein